MQKTKITDQFAERLRTALIQAGYNSSRSSYGVNVNKFAAMTGYSAQICRRYLRGEAIPEPTKLAEIAEEINVSPGWLLFGDCHAKKDFEENKITISKDLLHYIFSHVDGLYRNQNTQKDILPQFLLELVNNISQINADNEQSKKIVDLALFSIKKLSVTSE